MNRREIMRSTYPYVVTTLPGGTQVMRNRDYEIVLTRNGDAVMPPTEQVPFDYQNGTHDYFYTDTTTPYKNTITKGRCERVLNEWLDLMEETRKSFMPQGVTAVVDLNYEAKNIGQVMYAHAQANGYEVNKDNYLEKFAEAADAVVDAHTKWWFDQNPDVAFIKLGMNLGPKTTIQLGFEDSDQAIIFKLAVGDYNG